MIGPPERGFTAAASAARPAAPCGHDAAHEPRRVRTPLASVDLEFTDQPSGEADQDRRQGGEPRALRYVSDGRGRGAATDVPGNPVADRPVAGTARASMRSAGIRCDKRR